jgi:hypothetical protein
MSFDQLKRQVKVLKEENEAVKRLCTDFKRLLLKSRNKSNISHKEWKQNEVALIMLANELNIEIKD